MASGPDAFSATPRGFGCYDRELISAAADNLWSSSVVATASTGASWVDDVEVGLGHHAGHHPLGHQQHVQSMLPATRHPAASLEKRIEDLRRKFHRARVLQIKHLPREVSEEEIRELLGEWDVQSIILQAGSARVALCSPEVLEDWDRNGVFTVRGQRVTIVPSPTEMLLCVGRIPLSYTEAQFTALVSTYGEVKRSFLMISERTGESKGYGFVEYVTKEAALQAKNALDGRQILDFTAVCDWLDSSHITVRSLHSKCLYVDQLPPNYRNMGEFRRIFSTIVNPPYCQIALKNGCPQDWGLVEYVGEDDAERSQQGLDGYLLHGRRIRAAFYIPGVRAINLYLKLLNDGGSNKGRSALLPDPPAPAVFQQLQSLAKQNPVFAQNLQSIILQQIQDVQKGKAPPGGDGQGKRSPFQQKGPPNPFTPSFNNNNGCSAALKSAQQTALTLILASQGMGGAESPGGGSLSPNSASLQNQQLLSALQAVSKGDAHFLNGGNQPNLSSLLGLGSPGGGGGMSMSSSMSNLLEPNQQPNNMPHPYFPSPMMLPGSMSNMHLHNGGKEDQWTPFNKPPHHQQHHHRNNASFGSNGFHKSPLLPNPSHSPMLDVPMDTNGPKTPPSDPLQAVWYSLFGHSSPPDTTPSTPGTTSPLFMKGSLSSNSSVGSPLGRSASDNMFGPPAHYGQHKSSPPGFCTPNGQRGNSTGDLQEALNSLLSNPHLFGGGQGQGQQQYGAGRNMSPPPPQYRPNSFGEPPVGMSNAILDLLMHSMKGEQQQQQQQQQGEGFGRGGQQQGWSSGMSTPPSPIGGSRGYNGGGGPPVRNGSNGSSEMSGSSPRSPSYSPFPRGKGLGEAGNGNLSPTPAPWTNSVLGSPPGGYGAVPSFGNRIWAPPISPGNGGGSLPAHNPLGQKRKVHHESVGEDAKRVDGCWRPPKEMTGGPDDRVRVGRGKAYRAAWD